MLPVQHKASKSPGDDKQMVQARRSFLEQGHYHPFSEAINNLIQNSIQPSDSPSILDAGCGEGYYLRNLAESLASAEIGAETIGIDISKHAIIAASKQSQSPLWLVASAAKAPIKSHSLDLIYSLFTPLNSNELQRLLKSSGTLITATAGEHHLLELRERIYNDVNIKPIKTAEQLSTEFIHQQQQTIRFEINLNSQQDIDKLIRMTPHYWRSSPESRAKISALEQLQVTAEFHIDIFTPKPLKQDIDELETLV